MAQTMSTSFRHLHQREGQLLILPNAWDVCSAKIIESLGGLAIATTSAGVAWSQGFTDGGALPIAKQEELASSLVRSVSIPVTVDVEAGYSDEPSVVAENVLRLCAAGVAGINIEDGGDPPILLAKKMEAIKHVLSAHGLDGFINVRTDVYLRDICVDAEKVAMVGSREELYRSAGADGLFVPGLIDPEHIRAIASAAELPLNVMAMPGLGGAEDLVDLGVVRLSTGSGLAQCAWTKTLDLAREFLRTGRSEALADAVDYGYLQALLS